MGCLYAGGIAIIELGLVLEVFGAAPPPSMTPPVRTPTLPLSYGVTSVFERSTTTVASRASAARSRRERDDDDLGECEGGRSADARWPPLREEGGDEVDEGDEQPSK